MDKAAATTVDGDVDIPAPPSARTSEQPARHGGEIDPNLPRQAPDKQLYAGREWTSDHPLNIRMSIPLGVGRYYITIVAGKERRARARIASDRRQHPLDTPANVLFLFLIGTVAAVGGVALSYLLLAHVFDWSGRLIL